MVLLTYHSLEDRIVKQFFKERLEQGEIRLLNKKPLTADMDEVENNQSARSAKLRAVEKI
ncbi:MAG: 16S rRNA (cytosine(1402)-N(4))-methyltransferase [Spirochaetae bacterium HGW-Spirochaetae-6]|nr:MAG: 16S rRNA (cytosine(1402)-N(4))-methyltransferase [Spirochaetae bacterium HGW-Spirochaetae-6]